MGQSSPVNLIHSIKAFKPFGVSDLSSDQLREELYHDYYCLLFCGQGGEGIILNQKIFFVNEIFLRDK